jgi:hypothetical protein
LTFYTALEVTALAKRATQCTQKLTFTHDVTLNFRRETYSAPCSESSKLRERAKSLHKVCLIMTRKKISSVRKRTYCWIKENENSSTKHFLTAFSCQQCRESFTTSSLCKNKIAVSEQFGMVNRGVLIFF